jgi:hypothetical protein
MVFRQAQESLFSGLPLCAFTLILCDLCFKPEFVFLGFVLVGIFPLLLD